MMGYWRYGYNNYDYGFGFMGILMLVFWALIIAFVVSFIVSIIKKMNKSEHLLSGGISHKDNKAMDIIKERYARGEIDKKEFEEKKKDLS